MSGDDLFGVLAGKGDDDVANRDREGDKGALKQEMAFLLVAGDLESAESVLFDEPGGLFEDVFGKKFSPRFVGNLTAKGGVLKEDLKVGHGGGWD